MLLLPQRGGQVPIWALEPYNDDSRIIINDVLVKYESFDDIFEGTTVYCINIFLETNQKNV
jgi:hypothetical protein